MFGQYYHNVTHLSRPNGCRGWRLLPGYEHRREWYRRAERLARFVLGRSQRRNRRGHLRQLRIRLQWNRRIPNQSHQFWNQTKENICQSMVWNKVLILLWKQKNFSLWLIKSKSRPKPILNYATNLIQVKINVRRSIWSALWWSYKLILQSASCMGSITKACRNYPHFALIILLWSLSLSLNDCENAMKHPLVKIKKFIYSEILTKTKHRFIRWFLYVFIFFM